jgi:uncharacterized protein YecE (DUF72 family)
MIYVGTSGWSYPTGEGRWEGIFYPRGKKVDQLEFYSGYFNAVEVNSTFYRPVYANVAKSWAKKTPDDFRFAVKLYQKFTHPKMFQESTGKEAEVNREDFDQFRAGLDPLMESGKLGCLLAQFPPSFKHDEETVTYLEDLIRQFEGYPLAVELRHRSWTDNSDTLSLLEAHDVAWCRIDEPKFRTSVGEVPLTSKLGYFRFHGRNAREWWTGDRETRYNYLYSSEEIAGLTREVKEVASATKDTFVFYNNHYGAKAVVNALQTRMEFGQPPATDLPEPLRAQYPELALAVGGKGAGEQQ